MRRRIAVLGHESLLYPDLSAAREPALLRPPVRRRRPARRASTHSSTASASPAGRTVRCACCRAASCSAARWRASSCTSRTCSSSTSPSPGSTSTRATCSATCCATPTARGATLLMSTHDVGLGLALCSTALVLVRGRIAWQGPVGAADAAAFEARYRALARDRAERRARRRRRPYPLTPERATRGMLAILWKDLLIELRTKETLASLLLLGRAHPRGAELRLRSDQPAARGGGAGRPLGRGHLRRHARHEPLAAARARARLPAGLLLAPLDRGTIYLAKTAANFLFMVAAQVVLLPLFVFFFNLPLASTSRRHPGAAARPARLRRRRHPVRRRLAAHARARGDAAAAHAAAGRAAAHRRHPGERPAPRRPAVRRGRALAATSSPPSTWSSWLSAGWPLNM